MIVSFSFRLCSLPRLTNAAKGFGFPARQTAHDLDKPPHGAVALFGIQRR